MAVPIRVLWNLRISLVEKFSLGFVFVVGIITMVTAIVRSVSLESSANGGQVSTTWLILVCTTRIFHPQWHYTPSLAPRWYLGADDSRVQAEPSDIPYILRQY